MFLIFSTLRSLTLRLMRLIRRRLTPSTLIWLSTKSRLAVTLYVLRCPVTSPYAVRLRLPLAMRRRWVPLIWRRSVRSLAVLLSYGIMRRVRKRRCTILRALLSMSNRVPFTSLMVRFRRTLCVRLSRVTLPRLVRKSVVLSLKMLLVSELPLSFKGIYRG